MASNIVLKTYAAGDNNQGSVTPQNDALIYQCAVPMNGLFSGGTVTLSSANVLHVAAGFGIIGGRFFEVLESDISVQLSASGDLLGRLYIHLDLSNADNPISIETYTGASLPALTGDPDLNISSGAFDMELCTFNVNELTISNIVLTYPMITASNNQIRRATAYSVNDFAFCQSADESLAFICTTAGTTAVSEPVSYATVTAGNTVIDGTAIFKAVRLATLADQSLIAPVETNASLASQGYAIGKQFILNGLLCEATTAIAQGAAFVLNGNYKLADSVTAQVFGIISGLNASSKSSNCANMNYGDGCYCYALKIGNIVVVSFSIYNTLQAFGDTSILAIVPDGYRPNTLTQAVLQGWNIGGGGWAFDVSGNITLGTNGYITQNVTGNGVLNSRLFALFMYLAN